MQESMAKQSYGPVHCICIGIKIQSGRFPVRLIVELLTNKKCRIILTG